MAAAMEIDGQESYLSDDSSFYGDDETKSELQDRSEALDVEAFLGTKKPSLTEIAMANQKKQKSLADMPLFNPYEGLLYGRQLHESVDEFIKRLPPATSMVSNELPWIFVANPYSRHKDSQKLDPDATTRDEEAPPDADSDLLSLIDKGKDLLTQLSQEKSRIEFEQASQPAMKRVKMINVERDKTVEKIKKLAADSHCLSGKWMLFISTEEVNGIWATVAQATVNNELGTAAKVAPRAADDTAGRHARLICIYTKDFTDKDDVKRVLQKIRALGLLGPKGRPIYYKCDAYTHLHINSGNQYDIKPSLYSSSEVLEQWVGKIPKLTER